MSRRSKSSDTVGHPTLRPSAKPNVVRVLCVDDHAILVEGLKAQFAIDGRLTVVGRLSSAARLADEVERLRPSVVLLDIEMPGPDAFEMADRLHRSHPDVRIIVLSAHIRDVFVTACFAAGANAYFAKSDELEDIVNGIHDVVRSRPGSFLLGPKVLERCRPMSAVLPATDVDAAGSNSHIPAVDRGMEPLTFLTTLTTRESEVLRMIGKGFSRRQIAEQLCRSPKTIDGHQERIMKKLGIPARADLIRFAIREGLAQA
jgi:DNA-binding NarL/FixJ family response regulator